MTVCLNASVVCRMVVYREMRVEGVGGYGA